jgi:hypothetical protein
MHLVFHVGLLASIVSLILLNSTISIAQEDYRFMCKPPLKFMAGACVVACYSGYDDQGRWCELRRGGGSGGG